MKLQSFGPVRGILGGKNQEEGHQLYIFFGGGLLVGPTSYSQNQDCAWTGDPLVISPAVHLGETDDLASKWPVTGKN